MGASCGGHTMDYHFHVRLGCLYAASGGHSAQIGVVAQCKLYGKWEDHANNMLPHLDACGAHFGPTPDSNGQNVYHYHVQDKPPFTVGCIGPAANSQLMSVAGCRALYNSGSSKCDDTGNYATIAVKRNGVSMSITYDRWCPCFDASGSNLATNIQELPALSTQDIAYRAATGTSTTTTTYTGVVASCGGHTMDYHHEHHH